MYLELQQFENEPYLTEFFNDNGQKKVQFACKTMPYNAMNQKRNVKMEQDFGNRKSIKHSENPFSAFCKKMLPDANVIASDSTQNTLE